MSEPYKNALKTTINDFRIFVTNPDGEEEEITDLYWFEENGVHDWHGEGHWGAQYKFRFIIGCMGLA